MDEEIIIAIDADTSKFEEALSQAERKAESFGHTVTRAFRDIAFEGSSVESVFRDIAMSIAGRALDAGLAPLERALDGFAARMFGGLLGGFKPFAMGGLASTGLFAGSGGVIAAPAYFPHGGGVGVAGEAGAEAILPLRRGADGALGVASDGAGGPAPTVIVNISTPDARSFERSQSQVSAALARAVMRGRRGV